MTDWKRLKPMIPYVMIPVGVIFLLDFLQLVLTTLSIVAQLILLALPVGLMLGVIYGVLAEIPGSKMGAIFKIRLARVLPSIKWGRDLVKWLLEDVEPEESET